MVRNTARRGIPLIVAGVTLILALAFSLSFFFTLASADVTFAAPLCGVITTLIPRNVTLSTRKSEAFSAAAGA